MKIPAGTQPEQRLRLRGKGAPKLGDSHRYSRLVYSEVTHFQRYLGTDFRGDAFITVKVKIPTSVSGKEKELVEQLAELVDKKKSSGSGFFGGFGKSE